MNKKDLSSRFALRKEFPNSPSKGTILYPSEHTTDFSTQSSPYLRISYEELQKYRHYFKRLPINYKIIKRKGGKIYSVKRNSDGEIFSIGDIYTNRFCVKNGHKTTWELTGFKIQKDIIYLLYNSEGKNDCLNCGIGTAIKK